MKRFFLFLFATLLSVSMFAAGETGKTKAQAIPYDWQSGIYVSSEAGVGKWYVVNLKKDMTPAGPFNANGKTDDGKTDDGKGGDAPKTADTMTVVMFAGIALLALGAVVVTKKARA